MTSSDRISVARPTSGPRWFRILRLALVAVLLAGCGSVLAPRPDRTRYYMLSQSPTENLQVQPVSPRDLVVGIGPLRLPDYLARSERVVRLGDNQLRFMQEERWAEPLEAGIGRVLLQGLTIRLPDARILNLPTLSSLPRTYDVPVEVLSLLSTANGDAELHARWSIKPSGKKDILLVGETRLIEPARGDDAAAAVAALSRALDRCSEEITAAIVRLPTTIP